MPIERSKYLLEGLLPLYDHQLHNLENNEKTPYRPSRYELYSEMKKAIDGMNSQVENGQTMAFYDSFLDHVYAQRLSMLPKFEFVSVSRISYQPENYLNLFFDLVFPFNKEEFDSSAKCVTVAELPPFFQQKGKQPNWSVKQKLNVKLNFESIKNQ